MRLFAAVVPPAVVLDAVARAVDLASDAAADELRWRRPEQWHLTLGFYARVEESQLSGLQERLGRAAQRHDRLRLQLRGAGRFDGRVLWLRVEGDLAPLGRLAEATVAAAARVGIPTEDRAYRPHLTIARSRQPTDLRPQVQSLTEWSSPTWEVAEIVLVRSHLGPRPSYEVLQAWTLRQAQQPRLP